MNGYNMAAATYGLFPNMYNNQIALNDLSGLDLYYPTGMSMDPMLTMNGSIFGGMNPMMTPYPYGGGNYEDYYKNYDKYQGFMVDNQVRQQQRYREANLRLNAPQEGIQKQAAYLHEKIMRNEQQQIQQAYANFKESVRSMYGANATEEQIANRASTLYTQLVGKSLVDDIREHGRDSFTQGLFQTLTFGFADKKTAEENIAELTGQPIARTEKIYKTAGNAVGGALLGAGGALALSGLWHFKSPVAKALFKVPVLAAIGGVLAGIFAFAKD